MTSEQPQASSPPGAIQLGPVNIQISIRIASPGDNGSVTQVNAVVTAAPGSSAPPGPPDHADTVGSPAESRDIGRDITGNAIDGSSDDRTQDANCDPHNGCCGVPSLAGGCCDVSLLVGVCLNTDAVELSPIDIARILEAIFGNAPGNEDVSAQYQGDAVQNRPVNISVSIRISSPGNDGPVEQTNLVQVQASVSVEVAQAVQPLAGPLDPTIGVGTTVDVAFADGVVAQQEPVDGDGESMSDVPAPADIEARTTNILGPTPLDSPFPPSSGPVSPHWVSISRLAWRVGRPPSLGWITPIVEPRTANTDDMVQAGRTETAQRRPPRDTAPPAPPLRTWAPVVLSVAPASASSSGGGNGGGLAVALSLPFVLALLYSSSRRLRTSVSVSSAHITRRPERPG